jgi:hypothetical protein
MITHIKQLKHKATSTSTTQAILVKTDLTDRVESPIVKHLTVLGMANRPNTRDSIGAAVRLNSGDNATLIVPLDLLGTSNKAGAEDFLLRNGMDQLLDEMNAKDFGTVVRRMATGKQVIVIADHGYHKFTSGDSEIIGYAWQNEFYRFGGGKHTPTILLTDEAADVSNIVGDVERWNQDFRPYLIKNPRILVAVCFSLAAALFAAFGLNGLVLALIAMTSQGKSTILRLCASMIGNSSRVIPWWGTSKGVQDCLTSFGDQPSFFDDMHKADDVNDLVDVGMNVGNASTRLVSSRNSTSRGHAPRQIRTNLLLSSEVGLFSLARHSSTPVNSGLLARYFEIHAGPYGMFDDLCGHANGAQLSAGLDRLTADHDGAVWKSWLSELSNRWGEVKAWHDEMLPGIRLDILAAAGEPKLDDVTSRMIDSLTFAAFTGCVASKLGILSIRKESTITAAFGLVVREHIERQPKEATTTRDDVVEAVRGYVQSFRSSFIPLEQYSSPDRKSGIPGFTVDDKTHGLLYLFLVDAFKKRFEKEFGTTVYQHLRDADYLVTHLNRNNRFSKRVPHSASEQPQRVDFIAIKATIQYVK